MPQMSPINWVLMSTLFLFIMILISNKIYFFTFKTADSKMNELKPSFVAGHSSWMW